VVAVGISEIATHHILWFGTLFSKSGFRVGKKLFPEIKNRNILRSEREIHDPFSRSRPIIPDYVRNAPFSLRCALIGAP